MQDWPMTDQVYVMFVCVLRWKKSYISHFVRIACRPTEWRGQVWYRGQEVPGCFFWVLPKRRIPKPDPHEKDITQREESLDTDML